MYFLAFYYHALHYVALQGNSAINFREDSAQPNDVKGHQYYCMISNSTYMMVV